MGSASGIDRIRRFVAEYPLVIWGLSAVISTAVGFVSSDAFAATPFESTVLGLLTLVVATLTQLSSYVLELLTANEHLESRLQAQQALLEFDNTLKALHHEPALRDDLMDIAREAHATLSKLGRDPAGDPLDKLFREEVQKQLVYAKDSLAQLQSGTIRVVGDEAHSLWTKVVLGTQRSFFTTNVFRFRHSLLGARVNSHLLDLQRGVAARLERGAFERLFIYDEQDEADVDSVIQRQRDATIDAWKIPREVFERQAEDGHWIRRIGSEDFTVVDERFLYLTTINASGRILYVDLYRGGARLTAAVEFTRRLREMAKLFSAGAA